MRVRGVCGALPLVCQSMRGGDIPDSLREWFITLLFAGRCKHRRTFD
jgi:hypothetical protein